MKGWFIPKVFPYTHTHIKDLGEWPQRLLHVPTWTSYEWTPGNIYNGVPNPRYRAISYTWGRWRLHPGQKPRVGPALPIEGVPWDIPRIDPKHFTATEIMTVARRICAGVPGQLYTAGIPMPDVEFLWLDLACIDQRMGPLSALEVGRQAGIFRNASGVAIWLSYTGKDDESLTRLQRRLTDFLALVYKGSNPFIPDFNPDASQREEILSCVEEMLCDPWFSSLWTLQEAVLARCAFFVGGSTEILSLLPPMENWNYGLFTLENFADACRLTARQARDLAMREPGRLTLSGSLGMAKFADQMSHWVTKSGLMGMATAMNYLGLLTFARHRIASWDTDHIYGIMQLFGFQLGASRPRAAPDEYFDREELEIQFGVALLAERTLQSQLFVFTEPVDRYQGWRISRSTEVPQKYWSFLLTEHTSRRLWCHTACTLSDTQVRGETMCKFAGRACRLRDANITWNRFQVQTRRDVPFDTPVGCIDYCVRLFFPDVSTFVRDSDEYRSWSAIDIPDDDERQQAFGRYLEQRFERNRIVILFLGRSRKHHFGLIMLHVESAGVMYWHRLGTVTWCWGNDMLEEPWSSEIGAALSGEGVMWHEIHGLLG